MAKYIEENSMHDTDGVCCETAAQRPIADSLGELDRNIDYLDERLRELKTRLESVCRKELPGAPTNSLSKSDNIPQDMHSDVQMNISKSAMRVHRIATELCDILDLCEI